MPALQQNVGSPINNGPNKQKKKKRKSTKKQKVGPKKPKRSRPSSRKSELGGPVSTSSPPSESAQVSPPGSTVSQAAPTVLKAPSVPSGTNTNYTDASNNQSAQSTAAGAPSPSTIRATRAKDPVGAASTGNSAGESSSASGSVNSSMGTSNSNRTSQSTTSDESKGQSDRESGAGESVAPLQGPPSSSQTTTNAARYPSSTQSSISLRERTPKGSPSLMGEVFIFMFLCAAVGVSGYTFYLRGDKETNGTFLTDVDPSAQVSSLMGNLQHLIIFTMAMVFLALFLIVNGAFAIAEFSARNTVYLEDFPPLDGSMFNFMLIPVNKNESRGKVGTFNALLRMIGGALILFTFFVSMQRRLDPAIKRSLFEEYLVKVFLKWIYILIWILIVRRSNRVERGVAIALSIFVYNTYLVDSDVFEVGLKGLDIAIPFAVAFLVMLIGFKMNIDILLGLIASCLVRAQI